MTLTRFLKSPFAPLIILLAVNLVAGFLTFRDYGMSWDEPLFYDYADSIRLAYTPAAYAPGFDFYQVFGKSPEDHKIYGPAYLLLARPIEQGLVALGADMASAWHLVNFLTFQIGLAAFYCLVRRWLEPWPSAAATAFLAWQPVFWGHAFINPKDAPFMVFFLWALVLGLDFVDRLTDSQRVLGVGTNEQIEPPRTPSARSLKGFLSDLSALRGERTEGRVAAGFAAYRDPEARVSTPALHRTQCGASVRAREHRPTQPADVIYLVFAGIILGLTAAIRVIGPLAGALVFVYFLLKIKWGGIQTSPSPLRQGFDKLNLSAQPSPSALSLRERGLRGWRAFGLFVVYGLIAVVTMFAFWPYLWADPINRLLEVLKHMSNNPTELAVLFDGQIFRANEMPRRYLPQVFALTLTEPTWILFFAGLIVAIRSFFTKKLVSQPRVRTLRASYRTEQPGKNPLNEILFRSNQSLSKWCDALFLKNQVDWRAPLVVLGLFVLMLAYLLYNKPSVYDGFRHFLFITPPVFVLIGFSLQWLWEKLKPALWSAAAVLLLLPGLIGIVNLHPYEYAYYNVFTGGVGGAFRVYETEYWLTCYKEALEWSRANAPGTTLHIQREFPLAEYYGAGLTLKDLGKETESDVQTGDLLLFHTRGDLDIRSNYRKLPAEHVIGRDGAEFCILKRKTTP